MTSLSTSYEKTLDLIETGKPAQASAEYRKGILLTVKRLYSEAGETYPLRFEKMENWCVWTRQLYILSVRIDKALRKTPTDKAAAKESNQLLADLRGHFYLLHKKTKTQNGNDIIYALDQTITKPQPSVQALQKLRDALETTPPPVKAEKKPEKFQEEIAAWTKQFDSTVKDNAIDPIELKTLQKITKTLYHSQGRVFE